MKPLTDEDLNALEHLAQEASGPPWYVEKAGICGPAGQTYRISAQFTTAGGMQEVDALFCAEACAAMARLLLLARVGQALDDAVRDHLGFAYLAEPMAPVALYLEAERRIARALAAYRAATAPAIPPAAPDGA